MKDNVESMQKLINSFTFLPGVGGKTASRYAYSVITMTDEEVAFFAQSMLDAKKNIKFCKTCGNFTDNQDQICNICHTRSSSTVVCVVKEPKDVLAIEKSKNYNGLYHVLHGTISPLDGKGPDEINIKQLVARINMGNIAEVIMATNPDIEGEVTASYIAKLLKPLGIKVTRIAQGVSIGSDLQYADEVTITKALQDRKEI